MPIIQAQPALKVDLFEENQQCDSTQPILQGSVSASVLQLTGQQLPLMWSMTPSDQLPKCANVVFNDQLTPYKASLSSGQVGEPLKVLQPHPPAEPTQPQLEQDKAGATSPYLHLTANLGMECVPERADVDIALKADGQCHPYGHGAEDTRAHLEAIASQLGQTIPEGVDLSEIWYKASCDVGEGATVSLCAKSCATDPTDEGSCFLTIPLDALLDQCFNPLHGLPSLSALAATNHHIRRFLQGDAETKVVKPFGMHATRRDTMMIPISMQLTCVNPDADPEIFALPEDGPEHPPRHPPHGGPPHRHPHPPHGPHGPHGPGGDHWDPERMNAFLDGMNAVMLLMMPLMLLSLLLAIRRRMAAERYAVVALASTPTSPVNEKQQPPAYPGVASQTNIVDAKSVGTQSQ